MCKENEKKTFEESATASIVLDKRRAYNETGRFPVKLLIYFQQKRKYYSTSTPLSEQEWEKVNQPKVKDRSLREKRIKLREIEVKANHFIEELGSKFSFEAFDILFTGKSAKLPEKKNDQDNVFKAFDLYIKKLNDCGQIGTANSYSDAKRSLKSFSPTLKFSKITIDFLTKYERYMLLNGRSMTTVGIYLRNLRRLFNIVKKDMDIKYPFGTEGYEIPTGKNIKKALNDRQLYEIINMEPFSEAESWGRDMWLLSFYCNGMNMSDIFLLKFEDIIDDFMYFNRKKSIRTKRVWEPIEVYISKPAREIIKRWGNPKNSYVFDVVSDKMDSTEKYYTIRKALHKVNYHMKKIGLRLGLGNNLTTYVARHSWATTLMRKGMSVPYISKGFGHSSVKVTENYLADFDREQKIKAGRILEKLSSIKSEK